MLEEQGRRMEELQRISEAEGRAALRKMESCGGAYET